MFGFSCDMNFGALGTAAGTSEMVWFTETGALLLMVLISITSGSIMAFISDGNHACWAGVACGVLATE